MSVDLVEETSKHTGEPKVERKRFVVELLKGVCNST